jgi:hypothetical protein
MAMQDRRMQGARADTMTARRFLILFKPDRQRTLEREVIGTVEDALQSAWKMLQDGRAKVAAIVEVGDIEFHIWNDAILRWGAAKAARLDIVPRTAGTANDRPVA